MDIVLPEARFFQTEGSKELWERYCGFLDLSLDQFMEIQRYLLLEQIKLVANTPLGRTIMRGNRPTSVEEFRRVVPITSYEDYACYLSDREEDALAEKPFFWCHSAGRGGNYKWIPYTRSAFDRIARYGVSVGILAAAQDKGEVRLAPGAKVLVNLAPRPYASGSLLHHFGEYYPYHPIPRLEQAEALDFQDRTRMAFTQAMDQGIDYIFSTSTVLVKIGESLADQGNKLKLSSALLHPRAFRRVAQGWLKSRLAGRQLMPRDLWSPKGLVTFGLDSAIYESEIAKLWGQTPYQVYGTTEMMISAVQAWNKRALTFLPDVAFWEFIPKSEWQKCREDREYQPTTVLMNELQPGNQYELVYSHFYGMPLLRYRIGDVIKVLAMEDAETGVKLPQVIFQARASDIIDLAGLTQIDERTLWQALADTGLQYEEWCARKEYDGHRGYLRVYVELKEDRGADELESMLESRLRAVDVDYRDLEGWLGQKRSVAVTLLRPGTFACYFEQQTKAGASVGHLKPSHINPSDTALASLLQLSNSVNGHK